MLSFSRLVRDAPGTGCNSATADSEAKPPGAFSGEVFEDGAAKAYAAGFAIDAKILTSLDLGAAVKLECPGLHLLAVCPKAATHMIFAHAF